jgi:hypothetical protein
MNNVIPCCCGTRFMCPSRGSPRQRHPPRRSLTPNLATQTQRQITFRDRVNAEVEYRPAPDSLQSMSANPRKHRGPFRPVDSLSSPQKPSFQSLAAKQSAQRETDDESSFLEDNSVTHLGNSSNLFDEDNFADSPQYALRLTSHLG